MTLATLAPRLRDEPGLTRALGEPDARLAIVEVGGRSPGGLERWGESAGSTNREHYTHGTERCQSGGGPSG